MKKQITMIIAAAMLLGTMTACGGDSAANSTGGLAGLVDNTASSEPAGTYGLKTYTKDGAAQDISGTTATIEFRSGGAGTLTWNGTPTEFTWSGSEIKINGGTSTYSVSGDTITLVDGKTTMVFGKSNNSTADTSKSENSNASAAAVPEEGIKVTAGEWENLEWESVTNNGFTLEIPKGWTMSASKSTYSTSISVKDPRNNAGIYVTTGMDWAADQATADIMNTRITNPDLLMQPLLTPTVEYWLKNCGYENYEALQQTVPDNYDQMKATVESTGATFYDYSQILGDGYDKSRGITLRTCESFIVQSCQHETYGQKHYTLAAVTEAFSPVDEFENWLSTGVFARLVSNASSAVASGIGVSSGGTTGSVSGGGSVDMTDEMMEAWRAKDKSDDIYRQKQSDAILGYERVYDTETGDIYRADSGFMEQYDKMDGQRYAAATDDMYTEGYSGYVGFD